MEKKIAAKEPIKFHVEEGKAYFWCACGHSENQPLCDGSHQGTGITPMKYVAEKTTDLWFCQCKETGNPPLCDGTHAKL